MAWICPPNIVDLSPRPPPLPDGPQHGRPYSLDGGDPEPDPV